MLFRRKWLQFARRWWRQIGVHRLSSQAIILVIGGRVVEVSIPRGRRVESVRLEVDLPDDVNEWSIAIRALAVRLGPLLTAYRLGYCSTVVLYESPSSSSQLTSVAAPNDRQSVAAARLAALGAIGAGEDSAMADACEIGCDAAGDPPRRHAVAAADRNEAVRAIADLVEALGLVAERIVPIDAVSMMTIARPALAHRGPTRGWLHVGAEQSWLIVVGEGHLRLFRPIRFGLDQLTEVLTRPISINGARAEFSLSAERAAALLETHGIPPRDRLLDEASGLRGQHVMPLLQPVLQRVIVELKQSLRFGLVDNQRRELTIVLGGPGAGVAGLAAIFADAVECPVQPEAANAASSERSLLACGLDRQACLPMLDSCPNLLPSQTVVLHMARRFNRGVWIGLAAGLALIALDAWRMDGLITVQRDRLAELSNEIDDAQARIEDRRRAQARQAAWQRMENAYVAATDFSPDFPALLREVALATPDAIRLTRFDSTNAALGAILGEVAQSPTLTIEAYAIGSDADESIARFVEALRASPVVEAVALGSTLRSELDGRAARRFDLRIVLRHGRLSGAAALADAGKRVDP